MRVIQKFPLWLPRYRHVLAPSDGQRKGRATPSALLIARSDDVTVASKLRSLTGSNASKGSSVV